MHFYERRQTPNPREYIVDESKVVKEFARSAAGMRTPKPHNLRTRGCLKYTVNYLLTNIMTDQRKSFHFAYDFIFDRLRAVRQEIVIQDFDEITTIGLIEPIIMFLAYSLYRFVACHSYSSVFAFSHCYNTLCVNKKSNKPIFHDVHFHL